MKLQFTLDDNSSPDGNPMDCQVITECCVSGRSPTETYKGFTVQIEGHGTHEAKESGPVYIEQHEGEVMVHIWADINSPDPTHSISLKGARHIESEEDYIPHELCSKKSQHLMSCDDDGYCNFCGEQ